jgi:hypothetical protein
MFSRLWRRTSDKRGQQSVWTTVSGWLQSKRPAARVNWGKSGLVGREMANEMANETPHGRQSFFVSALGWMIRNAN